MRFFCFFFDFVRFFGGLGPSKPCIPSNTSFKIMKIVRCNFGRWKKRFQIRFWKDFRFKLGSKIEPTSIKKRFKLRLKFQSDFWSVPGAFLVKFGSVLGTLDPQQWVFRVGEVQFFRKSRFWDQMRFWIDLLVIFGGFGTHFGYHFGIKIASTHRSKNRSDFGSILDGFWLPVRFD